MKKIKLLIIIMIAVAINCFGQANSSSTYVNGYYRSNGTYVNGYYRTTPNNTINDNYSTYPNYNPYTGKQGTVQPTYSTPTYSTPTYSTPTYSTPTYSTPTYSSPSYNNSYYKNNYYNRYR